MFAIVYPPLVPQQQHLAEIQQGCCAHSSRRTSSSAAAGRCCWHAFLMLLLCVLCAALGQVMIAEVDSHKLFRMVSDVRALVVLLPRGTDIPAPYQLAASLKQKTSWDSM